MKKILAGLLVLLILLSLISCKETMLPGNDYRLRIVTTVFPPYDFARAISGGDPEVLISQLLRPGTESHTYDPTPADIILIENCDIFLCTGGESDAWVDTLLEAAVNPDMKVLRMIDLCETAEEEASEGMTVHHEHEDGEDSDEVEYDEHVWTSPKNAMEITKAIADIMISCDPAHDAQYAGNCTDYLAELEALDNIFDEIAAHAERKLLVFGDRFPFRYLCDAYGLSYRAAFPGCASESEPSAATMAYLIKKVKEEKIPVILKIEMSSGKVASAIAEETGAVIESLHSCHNRTKDEAEQDKTYLDLMYANADVLRKALGSAASEKGPEA